MALNPRLIGTLFSILKLNFAKISVIILSELNIQNLGFKIKLGFSIAISFILKARKEEGVLLGG
jgi:hypothetical protein